MAVNEELRFSSRRLTCHGSVLLGPVQAGVPQLQESHKSGTEEAPGEALNEAGKGTRAPPSLVAVQSLKPPLTAAQGRPETRVGL